jgi:hypothetical protein
MLVKAWLLIIYIGGHAGYVQTNDLATEQACKDLYQKMVKTNIIYAVEDKNYKCLPYDKAPNQIVN